MAVVISFHKRVYRNECILRVNFRSLNSFEILKCQPKENFQRKGITKKNMSQNNVRSQKRQYIQPWKRGQVKRKSNHCCLNFLLMFPLLGTMHAIGFKIFVKVKSWHNFFIFFCSNFLIFVFSVWAFHIIYFCDILVTIYNALNMQI